MLPCEIIFHPFELNADDLYCPLNDVDPPDLNYHNEPHSHTGLNCIYYFDDAFPSLT